jgi:hypothetical protein
MSIDTPAPTIISVQVSGARVDSLRPARPGELLTATVVGLADTGQDVATPRVAVAVNGTPQIVTVVTQNPAGGHNVQFLLDPNTATGSQTLVVSVDGRPSSTFNLPVSR